MNDKEKKQELIMNVFNLARLHGICQTKKEFASMVGLHLSTVTMALNGNEKFLSDKTVNTILQWGELQGLVQGEVGPIVVKPQEPDVVIPRETLEMYTAMAKSIDRLSALVERLTGEPVKNLMGGGRKCLIFNMIGKGGHLTAAPS